MIFLTTTAIDLDEELLNRCLVLTVNEDREQTQAIHRLQREQQTLEGLLARAGARGDSESASQRAAAAEAAVRGQPLRPRADLPRQPDPHPPRSHEVPDAHPLHRAAAPAPAARQNRRAPRENGLLHRSHASPISSSPTAWRTRCWAVRSTSCRRRRGACCCWSTKPSHANASASGWIAAIFVLAAGMCAPGPSGATR